MKVFCIGLNKTGTTSLESTFRHLKFKINKQITGERLFDDYLKGNYQPIINLCNNDKEFYQDIPFSLPNTYKILEKHFPDAKFILNIRDTPEIWTDSLIRFHKKIFYKGKKPVKKVVKSIKYIRKSYVYDFLSKVCGTPDENLYDKETLIKFYNTYNNNVIEYFKDKPDKLLVINLSNENDLSCMCKFLNIENTYGLNKFYHVNKS